MTGNIRLFRKNALREAFEAGQKSVMGDPSVFLDIFKAGELKGSAFLNEAINAPSFAEIMHVRRSDSPTDFNSWIDSNEKKLCIPVVKDMFNDDDETVDVVFVKGNKPITLEVIEEAVKEVFKTSIDTLQNNRRRLKEVKTPRYYCYYLAYFHCEDRLEDIGAHWAQKDHATVIHGANQISEDAGRYPEDKEKLMDIYIYLVKNGYDIDNIYTGERFGNKRTAINFINLDI